MIDDARVAGLATWRRHRTSARSLFRARLILSVITVAVLSTLPLASAAVASAVTVSGVSFGGDQVSPDVTVSGSGFGSTEAALGTPQSAGSCNGTGSDYGDNLYLSDTTRGWTAGQGPGDCIGLLISSYSNSRIEFTFGSFYSSNGYAMVAGDDFTLTVLGTTFSGVVSYPPPGLRITTVSLPEGVVKHRYSTTLAAAGGKPPYSWKLVKGSGTLPKGLHLRKSSGVISGTPNKNDAGTSMFSVEVLDAPKKTAGHSAPRNVAIQKFVIPMPVAVSPDPPITYTTFAGGQETLIPWVGQKVAVLAPEGSSYDPSTMALVVGALDAAWYYYEAITGREPTANPPTQYEGRDTIAVVTTSCGAACSYLGATGNEINPSYFQTLYDGVKNDGQYDQVMFYEFGRNFWFYGSPLAPSTTYGSTVTTGYAVLMRFQSMNAMGIPGAPYQGTPFATFESQVWGIAGDYDSDLTKTFANTLSVGTSPSVYGGTDFLASIVHLLATHYGGDCFTQHFWATAAAEPSAATDDLAVSRFVTAASQVAGVDLGPFFYDYWSFPQADGTTNSRVAGGMAALPSPSPSAVCPA